MVIKNRRNILGCIQLTLNLNRNTIWIIRPDMFKLKKQTKQFKTNKQKQRQICVVFFACTGSTTNVALLAQEYFSFYKRNDTRFDGGNLLLYTCTVHDSLFAKYLKCASKLRKNWFFIHRRTGPPVLFFMLYIPNLIWSLLIWSAILLKCHLSLMTPTILCCLEENAIILFFFFF